MILSWVSYALLVSALLGIAAWSADRALRLVGRPARLVWIAAVSLGVVVPLGWYAVRTWLPDAALPSSGLGAIALPPLSSLWVTGTTPDSAGRSRAFAELAFPLLWILVSVAALLVMARTQSRLRGQRATWRTERVQDVAVLVSRGTGPATVGVLKPQVVLPEWALELPAARRDMILRHELEHVRARDGLIAIAGFTLAALVPWNPALWWMLGRLRLAQEMDCDQRLIASGVPIRGYLDVLLRAGSPALRTTLAAPGFSFPRNSLRRRVVQMTHRPRRVSTIQAVLLGASAIGLGLLACDAPAPVELDDTPGVSAAAAPGAEAGTLDRAKKNQFEYRFEFDVGVTSKEIQADGSDAVLHLRGEPFDEAVPSGDAWRLRKIKEANAIEEGADLRFGPDASWVPAEIHEGEPANRIELSILIIDGEEWTGPTTDLKGQIGTLNVEHVEVIRGPAAVELYGPRAADGVIVVTTKSG